MISSGCNIGNQEVQTETLPTPLRSAFFVSQKLHNQVGRLLLDLFAHFRLSDPLINLYPL